MAARICDWISEGNTLREFCRMPGTPKWVTVYKWLADRPEFAERFQRARELGADAIGEETLTILDEEPGTVLPGGGYDSAHVAWAKARVDLRLKLLAKWAPKKWGEKATVTHEGGDKPLEIKDASPLEAARRIAFALAAGAEALKK